MTALKLCRRSVLKLGSLAVVNWGVNLPLRSAIATEASEPWLRTSPLTGQCYYLIPFNERGEEREWEETRVSQLLINTIREQPITDVFIFSHGWRGDLDEATNQYDAWIDAMALSKHDIDAFRAIRKNFRPLLVGLHWPSLPYGNEELKVARGLGDNSLENDIEGFAKSISNTRRARQAITTILQAEQLPDRLPRKVAEAFTVLTNEAGLRSRGTAGAPGTDCEVFRPSEVYRVIRQRELRAGKRGGKATAIADLPWYKQMLGYISFWEMKDRARIFGETGAHRLLQSMQRTASVRGDVRFHLMGHSFGCIVVSSCVAGPRDGSEVRPVDSLSLLQGAFSIWSYSNDAEAWRGEDATRRVPKIEGHYHPILRRQLVKGPIITTQSRYDYAVGKLYPAVSKYGEILGFQTTHHQALPQYGAVGAWGLRGPGCIATPIEKVLEVHQNYVFEGGRIYNIGCSSVISKIESRFSGAHSDIAHPQISHIIWQAALVGLDQTPEPKPAPQPPPVPDPQPVPVPGRPGLIRRLIRRRR